MSQELHYTSVPRGLEAGSRGFCTVAVTPGMPGPLRERLESLSGYQQVFPPNDPNASRNPVVFAHHRLNMGGRPLSVLSRVSFAGLDYTERSNKYAHHVVIDSSERPLAGPAWLLAQAGFMEASWRGDPRPLAAGRSVPQGDRAGGVARTWQAAAGDAGWAGVMAESFLSAPGRPVFVVFEPGREVLPLFVEALALLPAEKRWEVDFNTYFTQLPLGLTCAWRAVVTGTPVAKRAVRTSGALVIDLTAPLARAKGGALVEQARTGVFQPTAEPPAHTPVSSDEDRLWSDEPARAGTHTKPTAAREPAPTFDVVLGPPTLHPKPRRSPIGGGSHQRSRAVTAGWIAGLLAAFGLLCAAPLVLWRRSASSDVIAKASRDVNAKKQEAAEARTAEATDVSPPPEPAKIDKAEPASTPPPPIIAAELRKSELATTKEAELKPQLAAPLKDLPIFIELPKLQKSEFGGQVESKNTNPIPFGFQSMELIPAREDLKVAIVTIDGGDPGRRTWEIVVPAVGVGEAFELARFDLIGKNLTFTWDQEQARKRTNFAEKAQALLDSLVRVDTGDGLRDIALRPLQVLSTDPISLRGGGGKSGVFEPREDTKPWAAASAGEDASPESWPLDGSEWKVCVRQCRIDITAANSQPISQESVVPSADGRGVKVVLPADCVWVRVVPDGRFVKIELEFDPDAKEDVKAWKAIDSELKACDKKLLDPANTDEDKKKELQKEKADLEKRKAKLKPKIDTYDTVIHANKADLSMIVAIRLTDDSLIDVARIGSYADKSK